MSFNGLNTPGFKEAQEDADEEFQKVVILSKNNGKVQVDGESLSASMSEEMIPSGIEARKSRTPSRAHMRRHKEPILQRNVTQEDRYLQVAKKRIKGLENMLHDYKQKQKKEEEEFKSKFDQYRIFRANYKQSKVKTEGSQTTQHYQ